MGLELTTLRSRIKFSTDGAHQVPPTNPILNMSNHEEIMQFTQVASGDRNQI